MDVSEDGDFAAVALDFDGGAELTGFTVDLELVVQEVFLKEGEKENIYKKMMVWIERDMEIDGQKGNNRQAQKYK